MNKILLISFITCAAFPSLSQSKLLPIYDLFKLAECTSNSCMMKYAREKGFTVNSDGSSGSDQYHFYKERADIGAGKTDKLLFGIKPFWNSVNFTTSDPAMEAEYRQLIAKGEFKETGTKKGIGGGIEKSFTSVKYPGYSASITIQKLLGSTLYEVYIMRMITN